MRCNTETDVNHLAYQLDKTREERDRAEAERDKLAKFKAYVHKRLDDAGVPADPSPEENAKHGCRIEGRLDFVLSDGVRLRALTSALPQACAMLKSFGPDTTGWAVAEKLERLLKGGIDG